MKRSQYFTKSLFKLSRECPAKLFYIDKPEYINKTAGNEFLEALAEGGIQIGQYAKLVWSDGIEVTAKSLDEAVRKTEEYLLSDEITLYEPAFKFQNLLVRVDVLIKKGNQLKLIEVKAKSYSGTDDFFSKKGKEIKSAWKPLLLDIAFQKYVVRKAMPQYSVSSSLALCNKDHTTDLDGLYRNFVIKRNGDKTEVIIEDANLTDKKILTAINADAAVEILWAEKFKVGEVEYGFADSLKILADAYLSDRKIEQAISSICHKCEFRLDAVENTTGQKSGFHECWQGQTKLSAEKLTEPLVLDLWNYRGKQKQIDNYIYLMAEMDAEDFNDNETPSAGLSTKDRQKLQITKVQNKDNSIFIDADSLRYEMEKVEFPLHMIDFETASTALPFHKNMRPYEQIAFQFSHHIIEADGTVRHANQWLNPLTESFPNFEFVRQLRKAIGDTGSVFRYSNHENTILNTIHAQLDKSAELDKVELQKWIETITTKKEDKVIIWQGKRNMIDLCQWVINYYFDPATGGSNSIKKILPSILSRSKYLQDKYSAPVYGSTIASLNMGATVWIKRDEKGKIINPYKQLPPIIDEFDNEKIDEYMERFLEKDQLADGGTAMVSYNYMQFRSMSQIEKNALRDALLRYCELDTLAMVMLWEGFRDLVGL
ncbi:MAG: DUF2779 domain-containing protein [Candidatus Cloacimonetes bacterium]|nr:DUF2779 domain-containing protein [Candidatus Cloacimonadota bacterium]